MEGRRPGNITGALPLQPYSSHYSTNIIGALPLLLACFGCEASRKYLTLESTSILFDPFTLRLYLKEPTVRLRLLNF